MKKAAYFIISLLISLIGFAQEEHFKGMVSNYNVSERIPTTGDLFFNTSSRASQSLQGKAVKDSIKRTILHVDLGLGSFIPTNKAKLIGPKPTFIISFGIIQNQMTYDLTIATRFGRTKEEYQPINSDMTDHYLGGYIGIDILRDIWSNNRNQLLLTGGFGMDLFEFEPATYTYRDSSFLEVLLLNYETSERIVDKESKNIFSPNINFGLMYRYYLSRKNYLGVRYRYNIVDYNSRKIITDLTGNFHSVTIHFGWKFLD